MSTMMSYFSCDYLFFFRYHLVYFFRVKPDCIDMLPVPHRPTTPPRRIGLFGRLIYGNAASQNLAISASMTLCRRDELDATVAMLGVVPGDEALHPSTGLVDVCEAFADRKSTRLNSSH